jgi:predicted SAM-dependent methyltransferase
MTVPVKLNLGCGLHCIEGWVNVDNSLNAKLSKYPLLKFLL